MIMAGSFGWAKAQSTGVSGGYTFCSGDADWNFLGCTPVSTTCQELMFSGGAWVWDNTANMGVTMDIYTVPTDYLHINEVRVYASNDADEANKINITNDWVITYTPVNATTTKITATLKPNINLMDYDGFGSGSVAVYLMYKATTIKAGTMPLDWTDYAYSDIDGTFFFGPPNAPAFAPQTFTAGGTCVNAVNDNFTVNVGGGTTASVVANDIWRGNTGAAAPSQVTVAPFGAMPTGITLNADGTVTVGVGVAPGDYTFQYTVCDAVVTPANCATATVTIKVLAPCSSSGNNYVNLNSMYTGTLPTNVVLEWWTSPTRDLPPTPGTKVADPTHVTASGRYYVFFYDTVNSCYNTDDSTSYVDVNILPPCDTYCYKPGIADAGNTYPTKHGITALGRAGNDSNWPMVRESAWTVLEAKTKGFVVNRVAFTGGNPVGIAPANFVEGMMVYDTTNNCLKVYTTTDGITFGWYCMSTQACPE